MTWPQTPNVRHELRPAKADEERKANRILTIGLRIHPGFADSPNDTIKGKNTLRISDLLHHSGGFPADPQYPNKAVAGALYSQDKGQTLEMIKRTPLEISPAASIFTVMSIICCLDLSSSRSPVSRLTAMLKSRFIAARPTHTVFTPLLKGFKPQQIAATELNGNTRHGAIDFPNIRTSTLWGQVHDEKAFIRWAAFPGTQVCFPIP